MIIRISEERAGLSGCLFYNLCNELISLQRNNPTDRMRINQSRFLNIPSVSLTHLMAVLMGALSPGHMVGSNFKIMQD